MSTHAPQQHPGWPGMRGGGEQDGASAKRTAGAATNQGNQICRPDEWTCDTEAEANRVNLLSPCAVVECRQDDPDRVNRNGARTCERAGDPVDACEPPPFDRYGIC